METDTKAPTLQKIEKSADPSTNPVFYVAVKGVQDDKSGVKSVQAAVWSENNGQDDLKWYDAVQAGTDSWLLTVDARKHKNDTGKYQIHIYGTDNAGNRGLMGTTTVVLDHKDTKAPTLQKIEKSADPSTSPVVYIAAQGVKDDKSGVASVQFAVWSENGGQDDLKWYDAVSNGGNGWSAGIDARNHKNDTGRYQVHIYGTDGAGNRGLMGTTTVVLDHKDTKAPTLQKIEKSENTANNPVFYVAAKGVQDDKSGVASVQFAVWSENGGQDDLRWYNGAKDAGNSWTIGVNVRNHKNDTGRYQVHIYGTDGAGNRGLMGSTTVQSSFFDNQGPTLQKIEKSADPSTSPVVYIAAQGVKDDKSGVASVQLAVWSENNGQDDLRWYNAVSNGGSGWSVAIDARNHKNDTGRYQIHVYGTDGIGNRSLMGTTSVVFDHRDTKAPTVANSNIVDGDAYGGTKVIYLGGVQDDKSGVKSVTAAIWGSDNGQDDMKWYTFTNRGGGNWDASLSLYDHGGMFFDEGTYNVHVYVEDNAGNSGCAYTTQFYVAYAKASTRKATITHYHPYFDSIWVEDIKCSTGIHTIFFNMYNEMGDDITVVADGDPSFATAYLKFDEVAYPYGDWNLDVLVMDSRGRCVLADKYVFYT